MANPARSEFILNLRDSAWQPCLETGVKKFLHSLYFADYVEKIRQKKFENIVFDPNFLCQIYSEQYFSTMYQRNTFKMSIISTDDNL